MSAKTPFYAKIGSKWVISGFSRALVLGPGYARVGFWVEILAPSWVLRKSTRYLLPSR
jgi:hypothetical protein